METFIVVFTHKRNIGLTAIAYHSQFEQDNPIKLIEHVTPEHINRPTSNYTNKEKEIVQILSTISEQRLFKRFSKTKSATLKEFMDGLITDERYKTIIYPFIKETLYKVIRAMAGSSVPVYFKDDTFTNLYPADQLFIPPKPAQPRFSFELKEGSLYYTLKIAQSGENNQASELFSPTDLDLLFISTEPASFIVENRLYYFETLDHKKILPFINKTTIVVPPHQVKEYMRGFVTNILRHYDVMHKGFEINIEEKSPQIQLKMSWDLKQVPALSLYFKYEGSLFLADKGAKVFVQLHEVQSKYIFTKIERNYLEEKLIFEQLEDWGLVKIGDALFRPKEALEIDDPVMIKSTIVQWLNSYSSKLEKIDYTFKAGKENKDLYIGSYSLQVETVDKADWFEIRARVQVGEFSIPFIKFRKNLLESNPEYTLPNGQVFMLPPEWFTRFSDLFHYAKVEKESIRLPRSHFQIVERVKHGISNIDRDFETSSIVFPKVDLPENFHATLRPYQIEGFEWLKFLYTNYLGGILADDMGLGKTLQTIALLLKIYSKYEVRIKTQEYQPSLFDPPSTPKFNKSGISASIIVMPTSLLHNWQNEISKFAPSLKIYLYAGNNRLKSNELGKVLRHYHIVLTSYGILRNDIDYLKSYPFHYVILDESQYVKNPNSKIYEAIHEIQSQHKLVLTGTPIENSLVDLWAQMNFVNEGLLGSLNFFKKHFVLPITRQQNEEKEEKLQKLIQPFLLRRTKENVAKDLPPIMEQVIYCDMTPEQASMYEKEKSGIRNTLTHVFEGKTKAQSSIIALQALSRLRQLANHPAMVDEEYNGSSGKFEQILDTLEYIVAENHNVLIFSSFVKDLKLIEKKLIQRHLPYTMLTGSTREREKVIGEFNRSASIFLISLKAGGVGLNLTKADYVFMLNPWWNPAAESQAINRAHRIGQTKNVFVYRFISVGTIEEKIATLQQKKTELANAFVSSNNVLKDMSKEEIIELFS